MQDFFTEGGGRDKIRAMEAQGHVVTPKEGNKMASCDWKKLKGPGEAKACFRHCEDSERWDHRHSNKDISQTLMLLNGNEAYGTFKNGYPATCKAYDEYIARLDAKPGANKRKDRVTCVGLELPTPEGMDEDTSRRWCRDAYKTVCDQLGGTVLGGTAHFDEIHEYRDAETGKKRTSRPHLHVYAVPEVNGKLLAKEYTNKASMVKMNQAIEDMTRELYPGYQWQTGTKAKSRKSVEQLKSESDYVKIVAEAQAEAEAIRTAATSEAEKRLQEALRAAEAKKKEIIQQAEKEASEKRLEAAREARRQIDEAGQISSKTINEAAQQRQKVEELFRQAQIMANNARQDKDNGDAYVTKAQRLCQDMYDVIEEGNKVKDEYSKVLQYFKEKYIKRNGEKLTMFEAYQRDTGAVDPAAKSEKVNRTAADRLRELEDLLQERDGHKGPSSRYFDF